MNDFPGDIFTEPSRVDPDTLKNLGPLRPLAGIWTGTRGYDVSPSASGTQQNSYVDRIELQPLDPQTSGPQLLYGLRYHQFVVKPGETSTFHDQIGYWLWEPATGTVIQTLAIPRAQVAMASGTDVKYAGHQAAYNNEDSGVLVFSMAVAGDTTAEYHTNSYKALDVIDSLIAQGWEVYPLITTSSGAKFGKTEAGTVWLDARKTSVYRFYQFWINTADNDVVRFLKYFTFLSREEIEALEKAHAANPGAREAHRALAKCVTDLIHGESATHEAIRASEILFGAPLEGISEATFNDLVGEVPTKPLERAKLDGPGTLLTELLVHAGLCLSKGQARKDVEGGGIYVNNVREANSQRTVTSADLLFGKHVLLRKGKKNYTVLTVS